MSLCATHHCGAWCYVCHSVVRWYGVPLADLRTDSMLVAAERWHRMCWQRRSQLYRQTRYGMGPLCTPSVAIDALQLESTAVCSCMHVRSNLHGQKATAW